MIRSRLLEMMGREGIRFVARLSAETGINRRTLSLLVENRLVRFDADVLARLCAYFGCQPGDLLTYVPAPVDARTDVAIDHTATESRPAVARPVMAARPAADPPALEGHPS